MLAALERDSMSEGGNDLPQSTGDAVAAAAVGTGDGSEWHRRQSLCLAAFENSLLSSSLMDVAYDLRDTDCGSPGMHGTQAQEPQQTSDIGINARDTPSPADVTLGATHFRQDAADLCPDTVDLQLVHSLRS